MPGSGKVLQSGGLATHPAIFLPGQSQVRRSLEGDSSWGHKSWAVIEWLSTRNTQPWVNNQGSKSSCPVVEAIVETNQSFLTIKCDGQPSVKCTVYVILFTPAHDAGWWYCHYHHWSEDILDGTKGKDMNDLKPHNQHTDTKDPNQSPCPNSFLLCHPRTLSFIRLPINHSWFSLSSRELLELRVFSFRWWSRDEWYHADQQVCALKSSSIFVTHGNVQRDKQMWRTADHAQYLTVQKRSSLPR